MRDAKQRGRRRYCLVTSTHVCKNPRLVKEADALTAAGHDVRVIAVAFNAEATRLDRELASSRGWRLEHVQTSWRSLAGGARRGGWGIVERAAMTGFEARWPASIVRDHACSRFLRPLSALAAWEGADTIIAHNLQALPAAARAARRLGARLGFDIEDLHSGELPDTPEHSSRRALVAAIEARYLPRCDYLTASSPGIADAIAELYGVRRPVVVLNAFPAEHPSRDRASRDRVDPAPALYWFSQTLGPDRGVEDALHAIAAMTTPAHLYLRGAVSGDYRSRLLQHARQLGCADRVHLLDVVPPSELVARSAEHDVGLALEQPLTRNRDLCVTNKLFTYMLAGLAIAATDTTGQRSLLDGMDAGAFLYPAGDAAVLARRLDELLGSGERLAIAKAKASAAGVGRFSWEHESAKLIRYLEGDVSACAADYAGVGDEVPA